MAPPLGAPRRGIGQKAAGPSGGLVVKEAKIQPDALKGIKKKTAGLATLRGQPGMAPKRVSSAGRGRGLGQRPVPKDYCSQENLIKKKQELLQKQRQQQMVKSREGGWKNVLNVGPAEEVAALPEPMDEDSSSDAGEKPKPYQHYHERLEEMKQNRLQVYAQDPRQPRAAETPSTDHVDQNRKEHEPKKVQHGPSEGWVRETERKAEEARKAAGAARERAKRVEEFLANRRLAKMNKNRYAVKDLNGFQGKLNQIREQNYKTKRLENDAEDPNKIRMEEMRKRVEAARQQTEQLQRKEKIEMLKKQADQRANQLKEHLKVKREEAYTKEKQQWDDHLKKKGLRNEIIPPEDIIKPLNPPLERAPPVAEVLALIQRNIASNSDSEKASNPISKPSDRDTPKDRKEWGAPGDTVVKQLQLKSVAPSTEVMQPPVRDDSRMAWGDVGQTVLQIFENAALESTDEKADQKGLDEDVTVNNRKAWATSKPTAIVDFLHNKSLQETAMLQQCNTLMVTNARTQKLPNNKTDDLVSPAPKFAVKDGTYNVASNQYQVDKSVHTKLREGALYSVGAVKEVKFGETIQLENNIVHDKNKLIIPSSIENKSEIAGPNIREPVGNAPISDIPKTDIPKTDIPKTDIPKTVIPMTDIPKTDTQKADAQKTDVENTDIPKTDKSNTVSTSTPVKVSTKLATGAFDLSPMTGILRTCSLPDLRLITAETPNLEVEMTMRKSDSELNEAADKQERHEESLYITASEMAMDKLLSELIASEACDDDISDEVDIDELEDFDQMRESLQAILKDDNSEGGDEKHNEATLVALNASGEEETNEETSCNSECIRTLIQEEWISSDDEDEKSIEDQIECKENMEAKEEKRDAKAIFSRLEMEREKLEELLGEELFVKAYHATRVLHEDKNTTKETNNKIIKKVLGEQNLHAYPRILKLVVDDSAYKDN